MLGSDLIKPIARNGCHESHFSCKHDFCLISSRLIHILVYYLQFTFNKELMQPQEKYSSSHNFPFGVMHQNNILLSDLHCFLNTSSFSSFYLLLCFLI
ncbi:hypothetical protein NC651_001463 [Populus alba x Populus x berolinensis]|nr:hypothetical protein NC651_001463 [Populus alba x Populus x berolinensis]